jgi:NAD(P)-dependent dehydrogenase (short-subunit alcohol dehydrogenase family)
LAVARRFGREGFRVALVARSLERLDAAGCDGLVVDGVGDVEAEEAGCRGPVRLGVEQVREGDADAAGITLMVVLG